MKTSPNTGTPMGIDYINGMLNGISYLCGKTNFVPFFGAEEIQLVDNNLECSVYTHFKGKCQKPKKITTKYLSNAIAKELLGYMEASMFDGALITKKNTFDDTLINIKPAVRNLSHELSCSVSNIVSSTYESYTVKLESMDYGIRATAIVVHGNDRCVCLYFGFVD